MEIKVVRQILEWNEDCHKEVQEELNENNVKMINIMGSPGAGKTTFILNLIDELKEIQDKGIPVVQLNTKGACHIEAMSIKNIIHEFNLNDLDLIIVENIGNLVCPAEFDIGEVVKVALLSIPEGDDKVVKYPLMFSKADALILTKYDMIKYFKFNEDEVKKQTFLRNPNSKIFKINSLKKGEAKEFAKWLVKKI